MVSIKEELELAKSAKGAIKTLLTATSKPQFWQRSKTPIVLQC
jgi:hypothetical protein